MKFILIIFTFLFTFTAQAQALPEKPEDISPILIGETLPEATLYSVKNTPTTLKSIISQSTILVFYRGGWCPYCNTHLADLVKYEDKITALGYKIVAISPDDFQNLDSTAINHGMKYALYSDKNANLIKALGIGFKASANTRAYITSKNKGEITDVLPVPAVIIVNADGQVTMEYIRPNITQRISGKLLLSILSGLE